jgi:hypothetical protein
LLLVGGGGSVTIFFSLCRKKKEMGKARWRKHVCEQKINVVARPLKTPIAIHRPSPRRSPFNLAGKLSNDPAGKNTLPILMSQVRLLKTRAALPAPLRYDTLVI